MNWVFISILLVTVFQWLFTHSMSWFFLSFLVSLISRGLFLSRMIGASISASVLIKVELASIVLLLVCSVVGKSKDILDIIIYILLSIVSCLFMFIDDKFYLYIVEDDKEEDYE